MYEVPRTYSRMSDMNHDRKEKLFFFVPHLFFLPQRQQFLVSHAQPRMQNWCARQTALRLHFHFAMTTKLRKVLDQANFTLVVVIPPTRFPNVPGKNLQSDYIETIVYIL